MDRLIEFASNHWALVTALVVIVVLLVANEILRLTRRYEEVEPMEATRLINHEKALVLDIRESNEFQQGHIAGAKHIPLGELDKRLGELDKVKDRPIVAYCRTGQRSGRACQLLQKHGRESVYNLKGGINAWQSQNLPVTTKS